MEKVWQGRITAYLSIRRRASIIDPNKKRLRQEAKEKGEAPPVYDTRSLKPRIGSAQTVRRLVFVRDGEGTETGEQKIERTHTLITVSRVDNVDIIARDDDESWVFSRPLTPYDVRACGFESIADLRAAWRRRHRLEDMAWIVYFKLGDHRDIVPLLQRGGLAGGDYTLDPSRALDPQAPPLRQSEYEKLGMEARQAQIRRRHDSEKARSARSLADRMRALENAGDAVRLGIRDEVYIIAQRTQKGERSLFS
jgi:hypothetical protein